MDRYYGTGGGSTKKTDQTLASIGSGSGSRSWPDPLTRSRRRLASLPSAFLTPAFNACASATSEVDPTLIRLTRPRLLCFSLSSSSSSDSPDHSAARRLLQMKSSPLSPIGSMKSAKLPPKSPAYKTPAVKMVDMEEEVLVMDGVLVSDSSANIRRNSSAEFGSSANSSGGGGFYKMELCRSWEDLGTCRYGYKCQFAHGKEELRSDLRGPRSWKQKSEVVGGSVTKSVQNAESGKCGSKSPRYVSLPGPNTPNSVFTEKTAPKLAQIAPTSLPVSSKPPSSSSSSTFDWPPTEEEDALITRILYGPSSRRRLPVFEQICPM